MRHEVNAQKYYQKQEMSTGKKRSYLLDVMLDIDNFIEGACNFCHSWIILMGTTESDPLEKVHLAIG